MDALTPSEVEEQQTDNGSGSGERSSLQNTSIWPPMNLTILKRVDDFPLWATEIAQDLKSKGILYTIYGSVPLDTRKKRYHNELARKLILRQIEPDKAAQLSHLEKASEIWRQLKSDLVCCLACGDLKNFGIDHCRDLLLYQLSALDGCENCRLLLDLAEAHRPGWTSQGRGMALLQNSYQLSRNMTKAGMALLKWSPDEALSLLRKSTQLVLELADGFRPGWTTSPGRVMRALQYLAKSESHDIKPDKEISIEKSSILTRVSLLDDGPISFHFFNSPSK
jgi:hypothetical protein